MFSSSSEGGDEVSASCEGSPWNFSNLAQTLEVELEGRRETRIPLGLKAQSRGWWEEKEVVGGVGGRIEEG